MRCAHGFDGSETNVRGGHVQELTHDLAKRRLRLGVKRLHRVVALNFDLREHLSRPCGGVGWNSFYGFFAFLDERNIADIDGARLGATHEVHDVDELRVLGEFGIRHALERLTNVVRLGLIFGGDVKMYENVDDVVFDCWRFEFHHGDSAVRNIEELRHAFGERI